jgi:hypothetical protein
MSFAAKLPLLLITTLVLASVAFVTPLLAGPSTHASQISERTVAADVPTAPPAQSPDISTMGSQSSVSPPASPQPAEAAPTTTTVPTGYGCEAAIAYLNSYGNPEFSFVCPGYADGREAMTCINVSGLCAGQHLVVISDPCPAAYMNEAYNSQSWSDSLSTFTRPIDPYGAC